MIINPYILEKIRPYINPHLTSPCIQKHSNNETIAHEHVHKAHNNNPSKLFKNMFCWEKKSKRRKIKIEGTSENKT